MPSPETLNRFIAQVEVNAHIEALEPLYAEDASMQENGAPPRMGRDNHIANERVVFSRARAVRSRCICPVFVNGNHVVIRWIFEFDWLNGTTTRMEELAYQRWDGDRICEETFFMTLLKRRPYERCT